MPTFQLIIVFTYFVAQVSTTQSIFSNERITTQQEDEDTGEHIRSHNDIHKLNSITPIVKCPAGTFRGSLRYTRGGKRFFEFRSIPYAEPPKRFEPAVRKAPIEDEYDATTEPPFCAQIPFDETEFVGQEDCLYLSVSKPHESDCRRELSDGKLLPVLFWIHQGGYDHGNGSFYKGNYLLDQCIVLVTINYRLGALGFLTTGDNIIPGNLGLKDQVLALKWTRRNIKYFLGDPKQVTIGGSSAGGSAVTHHICSPMSAGLFSRGIAMSGTLHTPWSVNPKPRKYAEILAKQFKCLDTSSEGIKSCLLRQSPKNIVLKQAAISDSTYRFIPVVEPRNAIRPFQNAIPYHLLKTGQINKVPLLVGFVQNEGIFFTEPILTSPLQIAEYDVAWFTVAPFQFYYNDLNIPTPEVNAISNSIRQFYFKDRPISEKQGQNFQDLFSDRLIDQGVYETVQLISRHVPTYMYVNTYTGGISYVQLMFGIKIPVITHIDDEQFIFPKFKLWLQGTEQYEFSKDMVELWTNFMRSGKPFGRATERIPWDRTNFQQPVYRKVFRLDSPVGLVENLLRTRTKFWRGLGLYKYEYAEFNIPANKNRVRSNLTCNYQYEQCR